MTRRCIAPMRDYNSAGWQPAHGLFALSNGGLFGRGLAQGSPTWIPEGYATGAAGFFPVAGLAPDRVPDRFVEHAERLVSPRGSRGRRAGHHLACPHDRRARAGDSRRT